MAEVCREAKASQTKLGKQSLTSACLKLDRPFCAAAAATLDQTEVTRQKYYIVHSYAFDKHLFYPNTNRKNQGNSKFDELRDEML